MNYEDVLSKISARNKSLAYDKFDIIDWCSEVVRSIGNLDYCNYYAQLKLEKTPSGYLPLPCNFYKLDEVFNGSVSVDPAMFRQMGDKQLWVSPEFGNNVFINYYGFWLDENGYPELFSEEVVEAAYWYCLEMLRLDDFLNGLITQSAYGHIIDKKERWFGAAKGSYRQMTKNRLNRFNLLRMNIHVKLTQPHGI